MLTLDELHALQGPALRHGYWCEAIAHTHQDGCVFWLGSHLTATPRLALRWLRSRVRDVADQLDPAPAHPARCWLDDQTEHERALAALVGGELYALTLADDTTRYLLSARPNPMDCATGQLPDAGASSGQQAPTCAEQFTRYMTWGE